MWSTDEPKSQPIPSALKQPWSSNTPVDHGDRIQRKRKRFAVALLIASFLYLLSIIVKSDRDNTTNYPCVDRWCQRIGSTWKYHPHWAQAEDQCKTDWESSDPSTGGLSNEIINSSLEIHLNLNASSHLFLADNTWGDITFHSRTWTGPKDTIVVRVIAHHWRKEALERTRVCKMTNRNGGEGVSLTVPQSWIPPRQEDQVFFTVGVEFPPPKEGWSPNYVNILQTDMPLVHHQFFNLADAVYFGALRVSTTSVAGVVTRGNAENPAVVGDRLEFESTSGGISGSFASNDTLILRTVNGPIDVNVKLLYSENTTRKYPYVELKTLNGYIKANVALENPNSDHGGRFEVASTTLNGPINLSFLNTPHTSFLKLASQTTNGPQHIRLNKTYEGTFNIHTSPLADLPEVRLESLKEEDPSGKGRVRFAGWGSTKGQLNGNVSWGRWEDDTEFYGSVTMKSFNGKPTLIL